MNLFVNNMNELSNLKRNFKLGVKQVIETIENLGFSLAGYSQANSYSLEHGYFTVFFNHGNTWLKLDCSNDEQFPIVVSHCLKHDLLFIPITEILRIKSDSYTKKFVLLSELSKVDRKVSQAIENTSKLDNMLESLALSRNQAYTITCNCIEYRNFKLKSNRIFSISYTENTKEFFYSLLIQLLTSTSLS